MFATQREEGVRVMSNDGPRTSWDFNSPETVALGAVFAGRSDDVDAERAAIGRYRRAKRWRAPRPILLADTVSEVLIVESDDPNPVTTVLAELAFAGAHVLIVASAHTVEHLGVLRDHTDIATVEGDRLLPRSDHDRQLRRAAR